MTEQKLHEQYVKAVEYSHTLEKLLIMERENTSSFRAELESAERERDELKESGRKNVLMYASAKGRYEAAEAELARRDAAAGEPVGEVRLGDYDSDGIRPASVVCLHEQAGWENFTDGTKLYLSGHYSTGGF